jgi:hypothetical protein
MKASPPFGKFPILSDAHADTPSERYGGRTETMDLKNAIIETERMLHRALTKPAAMPSMFLDVKDDNEAERQIKAQRHTLAQQNKSRLSADYRALTFMAMQSRQLMGAGSPAFDLAGAELVTSGNMGLIGPLSATANIFQLGAQSISTNFSDDTDVPKFGALPTYSYLLEDETAGTSDIATDHVPLTVHTWALDSIRITRRLLKQSSVDITAEISALIIRAHSLAMQSVALTGNATTSTGRQPGRCAVRYRCHPAGR